MSDRQIFEDIFAPIAAAAGMRNKSKFLDGMANEAINNRCRVAWKMACSRGVFGTPAVALNGVAVPEAAGWSLTQWTSWLDSQLRVGAGGICSDTRCSGA